MSIGIVTVAYGENYRSFLPGWAENVAQLETKPTQVTIATDNDQCPHIIAAASLLGELVRVIAIPLFQGATPHVLANEAIAQTDTNWICRLDVDDLIYPHALNVVSSWPAEVCCFGINVNNQHGLIPPPVTAREVLNCPHNLLFAGSPFRRELWQESGGFLDIAYNDWAFWRACARLGATFHPTGTIDYFYRQHEDSTSSKVTHEAEVQQMLKAEAT